MTGERKKWVTLISATLVAPIFAATLTATLLALLIFPDLIFRTEVTSGVYRAATLREMATSLVGFSFMGLAFGIVIGWPAMLIGGLPLHRLLVRHQNTQAWAYALAGTLVGTVVMVIYFMLANGWRDPVAVFLSGPVLLSGPVTGFLSAGFFWLIRRPDRIPAP
jgi:hypothetical protein